MIADELYATYNGDEVLHLGLQSAARLTDVPGAPPSSAVFLLVEDDHATLIASYSPAMNDTYGHQAGDALLRSVADALHGAVRRSDVAARVGGDEFCIMLADADGQRAETVTKRIFLDLQTRLVHGEHPRISIGIPTFESGQDVAARLAAADAALYAAKRSGGNRVAHASVADAGLAPPDQPSLGLPLTASGQRPGSIRETVNELPRPASSPPTTRSPAHI